MARMRVINFSSATLTLIAVNVFVFLLQLIPGFGALFQLQVPQVFSEPWRLVTSMFMHGGFSHIFFNMYALMIFGPLIESRIGPNRFYKYYFLAGIVAAVAYVVQAFVISSSTPAVGASGAIMGIIGMVIMLFPNMQVLLFFFIPMSMRTAGIIFAAIDILGFVGIGTPGVANIAHLAGLAVGLALGYYIKKKRLTYQSKFSRMGGAYTFGSSSAYGARKQSATGSRSQKKTDAKTIELNQNDIDDYFKYGKL
jgi:hypothetical protein